MTEFNSALAMTPFKDMDGMVLALENCSPYLSALAAKHTDILDRLAGASPDKIWDDEIKAFSAGLAISADFQSLQKSLRIGKARIHLLTALCDLSQVWDWSVTTERLSLFADICLDATLTYFCEASDLWPEGSAGAGVFILALGKYGAAELNYSSDIDFTVFYDPHHLGDVLKDDPAKHLIRITKKLVQCLETMTPEGYVFRTDMRLRPDPGATAIAVSTEAAERYYELFGQNWERAAHIKARVCAGDKKAGDVFMKDVLGPFIWRRTLDYATIADIHSIKRQIHSHKGLKGVNPAGHNVKLGLGGIREIEFFAQTQQLILGGRHPELRRLRTIDALMALSKAGFVEDDVCCDLVASYARLRDVEHRLQMVRDQQTHTLPADNTARSDIAVLSGTESLTAFDTEIGGILKTVHSHYADLFSDEDSLASNSGTLSFTGVDPHPDTLVTLASLGFAHPLRAWTLMAKWLGGRIRATQTARARALLTRLAPRIMEACAETGDADVALSHFGDFLSGLSGGVTPLSLFTNSPELMDDIIMILGLAPRLAQKLSSQPAIIDAMVEPDFYRPIDLDSEYADLNACARETDYETAMNMARRAVREHKFRIGCHILFKRIDPLAASAPYVKLADTAMAAMTAVSQSEMTRVSGACPADYVILGMGKFGSREMTSSSDLDIMTIYRPNAGVSQSHGPRVISPEVWYARFTQRLINALSAVTHEGGMYDVDMALRPSGKSGPVAVTYSAFDTYYKTEAWTWEYMALTRARVICASSEAFKAEIEMRVDAALESARGRLDVRGDILDMRARLLKDKAPRAAYDIKRCEGGLVDLEFIAQYFQLQHPDGAPSASPLFEIYDAARAREWISPDQHQWLITAAGRFKAYLHVMSLTRSDIPDPDTLPDMLQARLKAAMGLADDVKISKALDHAMTRVQDIRNDLIKKQ